MAFFAFGVSHAAIRGIRCCPEANKRKISLSIARRSFAELSRVLNAIEALKAAEARVDILRTSGAHQCAVARQFFDT